MKCLLLLLFIFSNSWGDSTIDCIKFHTSMLIDDYETEIIFKGKKRKIKRFAVAGNEAVPFITQVDGRKVVIKIDRSIENYEALNMDFLEEFGGTIVDESSLRMANAVDDKRLLFGLERTQYDLSNTDIALNSLQNELPNNQALKKFEVIPLRRSNEKYYFQEYIEGPTVAESSQQIKDRFYKYKGVMRDLIENQNSPLMDLLPQNVIYREQEDMFYIVDPH